VAKKPLTPISALAKALAIMRDAEDNGNRQGARDLNVYLRIYGYRIMKIEERKKEP